MNKTESVIEGTAIDPVCGMSVTIEGAKHTACHEGSEHYFCSSRCLDKFEIDPELYLSGAHLDAVEDVPEGTTYTCPMHPEIRQPGPGSCPICGMALEPETVSLDEGPDPELIDMRRRYWRHPLSCGAAGRSSFARSSRSGPLI